MDAPMVKGRPPKLCNQPGCGRKHEARGLCTGHYRQLCLDKPLTPLRAHNRVSKRGEGHVDKNGYRRVYSNGKLVGQHRLVMEQTLGRKLYVHRRFHKDVREADAALYAV